MVCIHFRGVEIYDSLTKILSNNALHPPGPGTKSYVGVLGPNSNFSHQLLQCCMKLRITPAKYQSLVNNVVSFSLTSYSDFIRLVAPAQIQRNCVLMVKV